MTRLPELMASYGRYHRDPRNRATHFIGVPMIVFAVLVALAQTRGPGDWPGLAIAIAAALVVYYVILDVGLGLALGLVYALMIAAAEPIAREGADTAWIVFGVLFVLGWAFQLLGHRIEGNRPALLDNLHQILVAPIFLAAEAAMAMGLCRRLKDAVDRTAARPERA
ncbi:MAG TPA: Mpo1-like protein [Stellaceae bacterium]|nr:Mpo1-like protein [Stellaceae bacterium]